MSYFEVLDTSTGRTLAQFTDEGRARDYMAKHELADVLFLAAYSGELNPLPESEEVEYVPDGPYAVPGTYELVYRAQDGESRIVSLWAKGPRDAERRGDLHEAEHPETGVYKFEHAALTAADDDKEQAS